jgi:hypothetical protein
MIMKKIYFFALLLLATTPSFAQKDTLLFEGFEKTDLAKMVTAPTGKETVWVNWDKDAKAPGEGIFGNWYAAPEIYQAQVTKPAVYNQTAHSLSWLKGEAPGSTNVLISPPITITDDKSTLSWQSCPLQGPEFMDGYKVLISVASNDLTKAKPDTAFVAAEVTSYSGPAVTDPLDLKQWKFSKGYIHANGYKLKQYWDTTNVAIFYRGRLEPHTVSLAKYKGKKIFVHFYHDSSDDFIFELDNVLVRSNQPVGTKDELASAVRFTTYPNPVVNLINVLYRLEKETAVQVSVVNVKGERILELYKGNALGEMNHDFDVSNLPQGSYFITLKVGDKITSQPFMKMN